MSSRLEEYLDELVRPVPAEGRADWRREATDHIAEIVAAYEELGCSHEEAVDRAVHRFGQPKQVGRKVGSEVMRTRLTTSLKSVPLSLKLAVAFVFVQAFSQAGHHLSTLLETGSLMVTLPVPGWFFLVGVGLLLRRPFWWKMAVASSCFSIILAVLGLLLAFNHPATYPPLHQWVLFGLLYGGHLWLLTRGEVRDFFIRPRSHPRIA